MTKTWVWTVCNVGILTFAAACSAAIDETPSTATVTSGETADDTHHGPPPEAYTACESKASGDACTVTTPDGKALSGTCEKPPPDASNTALACRPSGPPPDRR